MHDFCNLENTSRNKKNIQNWMVITIEFNLHKLYIFIEIKTLYLHVNSLE